MVIRVDESLRIRIDELVRAGSCKREVAAAQLEAEIRRREELMRQTFRRYVSPRLADKILEEAQLADSLETGEVRTRAVVLFADLRGFTGLSERLAPQQVVPLLNAYFSLLTEISFRHEGTVFHMAGDSLMLGFGVPLPQHDSTVRAVRAAREMLERFSRLARSWMDGYQIEAGLGIGINEGDVVAGNIGSSAYMSYTIIGDTVNIAARLCQRARSGEMLFSRAVKESLDAAGVDAGGIALPAMQLRGRVSPIELYCVPAATRVQVSTDEAAAG
jgi:class 3 adenylate cyclase